METPLFFKNGSYKLFGVIHSPDNGNSLSSKEKIGVVICHPFAEEKLIAHRVLVNLARKLSREGISCLRFDYMGHGDSDGNFEESTVETRLSDIKCAIELLHAQTEVNKIGLIGVRFGATLAAMIGLNNSQIDFLALISPVINGKTYIDQCLRSNLTTQMAVYKEIKKDRMQLVSELMSGQVVNIDGYLLTKSLYEQISGIDLLNDTFLFPCNTLLIHISRTKKQLIEKNMEKLFLRLKKNSDCSDILNIKEDYFWTDTKHYFSSKEKIYEAVLNWIKRALFL